MSEQRGLQRLPSSRQRFLARAIVASTRRIVDQALQEAWDDIPRTQLERRALLSDLEQRSRDCARAASCVAALRSALLESDRAVDHLRRRHATH